MHGIPSLGTNLTQMDALLNKFIGLRNILRSRRGSFERLVDTAATERSPDVSKLAEDYGNVSAELNSRINKVSDALLRLKEFNNLYEAYLGWLACAEPRLNKIPVDQDPTKAFSNRMAELNVTDSLFLWHHCD